VVFTAVFEGRRCANHEMEDSVRSGPVIRDIGDTARWAAIYRRRD
jgi:hypothetical protein